MKPSIPYPSARSPRGGTRIAVLVCAAIAFIFTVATSRAGLIVNGSLLADTVLTDGGFNLSVTGWNITTSVLTESVVTHNPTGAEFAGAAGLNGIAAGMSGPQDLEISTGANGGWGYVTQTTGTTLTLNTTYVLSVAVGNPANQVFQGYSLSLLSGTTVLATSGALYNVTAGTFATETLNFTATSAYAALVNTPITVQLMAPAMSGLGMLQTGGTQFDNVQFVAVPEPSSCGLAVLGTLGTMVWKGRARARRRVGSLK